LWVKKEKILHQMQKNNRAKGRNSKTQMRTVMDFLKKRFSPISKRCIKKMVMSPITLKTVSMRHLKKSKRLRK
jgi:hypothetical protein